MDMGAVTKGVLDVWSEAFEKKDDTARQAAEIERRLKGLSDDELKQIAQSGHDAIDELVLAASGDEQDLAKAALAAGAAGVLSERQARRRKSADLMKQFERFDGSLVGDEGGGGSLGAEQAEQMVKALRSRSSFGADVQHRSLPGVKARTKAALGSPATTETFRGLSGGNLLTEALLAPDPYTSMPLRDLFPLQLDADPIVRFYRLSGAHAGVVAEGERKPDAGLTAEPVELRLQKLASTHRVSDEMTQDAPGLVDWLNRIALRGLLGAENKLIVDALEAAPGALEATGPSADAIDILAGAIGMQEGTNGTSPNVILLNPSDLAAMRMAKAGAGGEYRFDPLVARPPTLHGAAVISSPAVAVGRIYLLTDGCGVFFTRGQVRLEANAASEDDFVRNLVTFRVEERVGAGIVQPSLITRVTLTV